MKTRDDVFNETVSLLKQDEKNLVYFFSKVRDIKWFKPLRDSGLFDPDTIPQPVKTEKGFTLSFWPQQHYLEHLSKIIADSPHDYQLIKDFILVLRKISTTHGNWLLGRCLFTSLMRMPPGGLTPDDIKHAFHWLIEPGAKESLLEITVHESLLLLTNQIEDKMAERDVFKTFIKHLLTRSEEKKKAAGDPNLLFFSDFRLSEFRNKYFNVEKLAADKPFLLFDALEICEAELTDILTNSDLDETTQYWRPAVEDHYQNNYHDSAQSVLVGSIWSIARELRLKQLTIPRMSAWADSKYLTFKRIFLSVAALESDKKTINNAAKRVIEGGLKSECRHEIYHFLQKQFEHLDAALQEEILDLIAAITADHGDTSTLNARYAAWEKLRWLEAIAESKNTRVEDIRKQLLVITEGKVPDHPDFSSYMGASWVGPTSPKTLEDLAKQSPEEMFSLLRSFKNSPEFGSPSVDGLARILQDYIAVDPMKCSSLISKMDQLDYHYVSALFDGYTKAWGENKYVPLQDIISKILELIELKSFRDDVVNTDSKARWIIASVCGFIESGTRSDDKSFPVNVDGQLYSILSKCLDLCPVDERYRTSSDAYTRAINEPRGRIFGALIILSLRRARTSQKDSVEFKKAWSDLQALIEPALMSKSGEVSLHALLGAYYRQFFFLNKDWFVGAIDMIVPASTNDEALWKAFMDGFSYVTAYSKEMYEILSAKNHLLPYLRYEQGDSSKSSRSDRLQNRVIELALVAYILGHEKIDENIVGAIIEAKDSKEWHQVIWSINSVIGDKPTAEHQSKAKDLLLKLISIKESGGLGESWKPYFQGLGRFLDRLNDPTDLLVQKIFQIVSSDTDSPWELGDLIEYLHRFRESHSRIVGQLFTGLLQSSNTAPSWPDEKVREICQSLIGHSETESMTEICRIYSARTIACEPIRDICNSLK